MHQQINSNCRERSKEFNTNNNSCEQQFATATHILLLFPQLINYAAQFNMRVGVSATEKELITAGDNSQWVSEISPFDFVPPADECRMLKGAAFPFTSHQIVLMMNRRSLFM